MRKGVEHIVSNIISSPLLPFPPPPLPPLPPSGEFCPSSCFLDISAVQVWLRAISLFRVQARSLYSPGSWQMAGWQEVVSHGWDSSQAAYNPVFPSWNWGHISQNNTPALTSDFRCIVEAMDFCGLSCNLITLDFTFKWRKILGSKWNIWSTAHRVGIAYTRETIAWMLFWKLRHPLCLSALFKQE